MAINFPDSPTTGQSFTAAGRTWVWDGSTWNNNATSEFGSVQFDATADAVAGIAELAWNEDQETLDLGLDANVTLQIGQEQLLRVKNASGSVAIPKGTFVQFAGAAGDTVTVAPAVTDGSVPHDYMVGITAEQIAADGFGFVTQVGFIEGLNTSAYSLGAILYANSATPGGLTATKPTAPNLKLPIAAVTRVHASTGRILVRMTTGLLLSELHDVQTNGRTAGDVLQWDGTKWVNSPVAVSEVTGLQTALDGKQAIVANVSDTEIGYLDGVTSAIQTQLNAKQDILAAVSTVSGAYTLQVTDTNDLLQANGTFTITVPANTFSTGARVDVANIGSGTITFAGSGLTISSKDAKLTINKQFAAATLFFTSATTALLIGDLA
jgi:hypothetical protein